MGRRQAVLAGWFRDGRAHNIVIVCDWIKRRRTSKLAIVEGSDSSEAVRDEWVRGEGRNRRTMPAERPLCSTPNAKQSLKWFYSQTELAILFQIRITGESQHLGHKRYRMANSSDGAAMVNEPKGCAEMYELGRENSHESSQTKVDIETKRLMCRATV